MSFYQFRWWFFWVLFIMAGFFLLGKRGFLATDRALEARSVHANNEIPRLTDADLANIQEGDIILRKGYGMVSNWVSQHLNSGRYDISHSGLLTHRNDRWWVIHTLSSEVSEKDGMQVETLDAFLRRSVPGKVIISRLKDISDVQAEMVVKRAVFYLQQQTPFDHAGVIDDTGALFCTELIWTILAVDLTLAPLPAMEDERKRLLYNMASLYDTNRFELVVNKFEE